MNTEEEIMIFPFLPGHLKVLMSEHLSVMVSSMTQQQWTQQMHWIGRG